MKVIIFGAGPAGCSTAWYLKQIGINDITIVEKNVSNLGGCSNTRFYHEIPYEYGPQILYTDELDIQKLFEKWLVNHKPPTEDGEYHPKVSIDGKITDVHDFPITIANVLKQKDPSKVIFELYKLNLDKPNFSNFEAYMLSRVGKTLYDIYVKNYNLKQWKANPTDIDADWAKERTLTLRERNDMFQGRWQGHPGNYNPLWSAMVKKCNLIEGNASISEDMKTAYIDDKKIIADLIISTLPLGKEFEYIHSFKVFVGLGNKNFLMPSYITTFPNHYPFTRIMEYKQQYYVKSDYSLLDFAFTWNDKTGLDKNKCMESVVAFVKKVLKRPIVDIWGEEKKFTYPVHTKKSKRMIKEKFVLAANSHIVPMGRCGVHAYVSKDVTMRMARILSNNLEKVMSRGKSKLKVIESFRDKLR